MAFCQINFCATALLTSDYGSTDFGTFELADLSAKTQLAEIKRVEGYV